MKNPLMAFDYRPTTRLVYGEDSIGRIGEFVSERRCRNVLLVTDRGVSGAGLVDMPLQRLREAAIEVHVFDRVIENPTTETVNECVAFAKDKRIDLILGFGGGSSLDTAKGCNFLLTNGGEMKDYWGMGKATQPMLPLIAVPTTAGTGSECQSFALISDAETHRKMACGDPKAAPVLSILDPKLTVTQPSFVAACTGMDAIAHAVESAVTKKRNAISWLFACESFKRTHRALPAIFDDPGDMEARGQMLLGAAFAGMAIENSMLGSAHATANPLTAAYGIVHGQAVGLMLPYVIRRNAHDEGTLAIYHALAVEAGLSREETLAHQSVEHLITCIESILEKISLKRTLREFDVDIRLFPSLAQQAVAQWTGSFNPRNYDMDDYVEMYQECY
jgi:alcohol dehydrogenase